MSRPLEPGLWREVLGWFVFPIVPVVLTQAYGSVAGFVSLGRDPREWDLLAWVVLTGPLWGYGFLAGATLRLPDDLNLRGFRSLATRRAVWVGVGPWLGLLGWTGLYFIGSALDWVFPGQFHVREPKIASAFWSSVLEWTFLVGLIGTFSYGWTAVAFVALRRAKRLGPGQLRSAFGRGLAGALAFVGSLFGSFWAVTSVWRSHFFDPTIVARLILVAIGLSLISGCGSDVTVGDLRRRELYDAMLLAWVLGLAIVWRWWSRSRSGPSQ